MLDIERLCPLLVSVELGKGDARELGHHVGDVLAIQRRHAVEVARHVGGSGQRARRTSAAQLKAEAKAGAAEGKNQPFSKLVRRTGSGLGMAWHPLIWACKEGNTHLVEALLERKGDVDSAALRGRGPSAEDQ